MVLILAAKRLPAGRAVGVDLWSTVDQSGNREQATLRNAELEGVLDRIELRTADMRQLPFPDQSFDAVTSSLAIHNIRDAQGREQALAEILRVLKAGGTAMIADILHAAAYQSISSASQPRYEGGVSPPWLAILVRRAADCDRVGESAEVPLMARRMHS